MNGGSEIDTAYYDAGLDPVPVAVENRIAVTPPPPPPPPAERAHRRRYEGRDHADGGGPAGTPRRSGGRDPVRRRAERVRRRDDGEHELDRDRRRKRIGGNRSRSTRARARSRPARRRRPGLPRLRSPSTSGTRATRWSSSARRATTRSSPARAELRVPTATWTYVLAAPCDLEIRGGGGQNAITGQGSQGAGAGSRAPSCSSAATWATR